MYSSDFPQSVLYYVLKIKALGMHAPEVQNSYSRGGQSFAHHSIRQFFQTRLAYQCVTPSAIL